MSVNGIYQHDIRAWDTNNLMRRSRDKRSQPSLKAKTILSRTQINFKVKETQQAI